MLRNLDDRGRALPAEVPRLPSWPSGWSSRLPRVDRAARLSGLQAVADPDDAGGTAPKWIPLRQIFWLISEYRRRCAGEADAQDLASILGAIVQFARHGFALAGELQLGGANFAADRSRCLADLGQVLNLLIRGEPPPAAELVHAVDDLIVQFVNIDDAARRCAEPAPALRCDAG